MIILQIIWLILHGGMTLLYAPWAYNSYQVLSAARQDDDYQQYADQLKRQLISAACMTVVSATYFVVGVLQLISPSANESASIGLILGSVLVNIPAWHYYSTLNRPREDNPLRGNLVISGVLGSLMFLLVIWAIVRIENAPRRTPPPFIYQSAEMPMLEPDGTPPPDGELPEYCPGDPLKVRISGYWDGQQRTVIVSGKITRLSESGEEATFLYRDFTNFDAGGNEGDVTFVFSGDMIDGSPRLVPENAPPGIYAYEHGSREEGGESGGFVSHFAVIDCN